MGSEFLTPSLEEALCATQWPCIAFRFFLFKMTIHTFLNCSIHTIIHHRNYKNNTKHEAQKHRSTLQLVRAFTMFFLQNPLHFLQQLFYSSTFSSSFFYNLLTVPLRYTCICSFVSPYQLFIFCWEFKALEYYERLKLRSCTSTSCSFVHVLLDMLWCVCAFL